MRRAFVVPAVLAVVLLAGGAPAVAEVDRRTAPYLGTYGYGAPSPDVVFSGSADATWSSDADTGRVAAGASAATSSPLPFGAGASYIPESHVAGLTIPAIGTGYAFSSASALASVTARFVVATSGRYRIAALLTEIAASAMSIDRPEPVPPVVYSGTGSELTALVSVVCSRCVRGSGPGSRRLACSPDSCTTPGTVEASAELNIEVIGGPAVVEVRAGLDAFAYSTGDGEASAHGTALVQSITFERTG